MASDNIIGVPYEEPHPMRSLLQDDATHNQCASDSEISRRLFQIRMADSSGSRSAASILINKMYATRGYRGVGLPEQPPPDRVTLVASEQDSTVGTITVGFDTPGGLLVDEFFADKTQELRTAGHTLCEFTKLAMDSVVRSRRVLASLFHVAYIYSRRIMGVDSLLIEVNPRHVAYYKRMLGFRVVASERLNHRVDAPAVLMCLDFAHAHSQIAQFGGRAAYAYGERSLYPFFFSIDEEAGITGRLKGTSRRQSHPSTRPSRPVHVGHPMFENRV